jgi:hypothetical protein
MTLESQTLSEQIQFLETLGSRLTGSPAHNALIEDVAARLAGLGLAVQRDRHQFTRWNVPDDQEHLRLTIQGADVGISSAYPYSGTTGPAGVAAKLHLLSGLCRTCWSAARGAIAVFEVPHIAVPRDLLVEDWDKSRKNPPASHPVFSDGVFGPDLDKARQASVKGFVLVWRGLAVGNASRQYVPFTEPYHDLPAVWVAGEAGERVLAAARAGQEARLVLNAEITPNTGTDTVWALSEGENRDESLLIVTHSDGTNVVEENGHIALLELARAAVSRPHRRTMVFVYTTGHLRIPAISQHGQATSAWLDAHPDLWMGGKGQAKAVGGIVIEHLGAVEYAQDSRTGSYGPTGKPEPETLYATTPELRDVVLREWRGDDREPIHPVKPGPLIHFGEGEPLFQRNIPAVALVTGPQYLVAEITGKLVDVDMMRRQIDSCLRLLWRFDDLAAFGTVVQPTLLQKAVAGIRVLAIRLTTLLHRE